MADRQQPRTPWFLLPVLPEPLMSAQEKVEWWMRDGVVASSPPPYPDVTWPWQDEGWWSVWPAEFWPNWRAMRDAELAKLGMPPEVSARLWTPGPSK